MNKFNYIAPNTIEEVIEILNNKKKNNIILAGGTDLLIKIRKKLIKPDLLVSLKKIKKLNDITFDIKKGITIGANVTLSNITKNNDIINRYPTIAKSALMTANPQVRNLGTLTGNICNASPAADNAPILLAMNSVVNIISSKGKKNVQLENFFLGPGETTLANDEIVESIFVPIPPPRFGTSYINFSQNSKISCTIAGVATMLIIEDKYFKNARIFIGACGPTPIRATKSENELINKNFENNKYIKKASILSQKDIMPITDIRSSSVYRKNLVTILTERSLESAKNMALSKKKL